MSTEGQQKERFAPKQPVELADPKDDVITLEHLQKCNGETEGYPTYVAIKKTVFDVTGKETYAPGKSYHVFAGKEPNRALGLSSLAEADCVADYESLTEQQKGVLNDWYTFFSKRYNIVGRLVDESGSNL
ncbi:progesterone binding protein-like protein [Lophiostoma macrostomum CBS 122681]|uniref:Progesterone binding protein-like protein n=1 Tax=Lophiostoma macrostomum CBS 122681 TaxID=1314788 RepID=A0A6A6TR26_9PLEO|nr:progesterone binding protein-like protein [Lophiostoma macrostomum CBS 122681]